MAPKRVASCSCRRGERLHHHRQDHDRIAQRQVRCHADANRAFIFRTSNPPISIRSEDFRADPIGQRDRRVGAAPC